MGVIKRIEAELQAQGLKRSDLGNGLGVAHQVTYNWWQRESLPKGYISQVAEFLGVTTNWLLTGDEPKHPLKWGGDVSMDEITEYLKDPDIRRLIIRYALATDYGQRSVRAALDLDDAMKGEDHSPVSDEAIGPADEDI